MWKALDGAALSAQELAQIIYQSVRQQGVVRNLVKAMRSAGWDIKHSAGRGYFRPCPDARNWYFAVTANHLPGTPPAIEERASNSPDSTPSVRPRGGREAAHAECPRAGRARRRTHHRVGLSLQVRLDVPIAVGRACRRVCCSRAPDRVAGADEGTVRLRRGAAMQRSSRFPLAALVLLGHLPVAAHAAGVQPQSEPATQPATGAAEPQDSERTWLARAGQTAESIADPQLRAWALRDVAGACAAAGDCAEAMRIAGAIADPGLKGSALALIAQEGVKAGEGAAARSLAESIPDPVLRSAMLRGVAEAQAATGDRVAARQTADLIVDAEERASALGAIAGAQVSAGDLAGALESLEAIDDQNGGVAAKRDAARLVAEAGDWAAARALAGTIQDAEQRDGSLFELSQAQAEAGRLAEARQTADAIGTPSARSFALLLIGAAQCEAGDRAAAAETARAGLRAAQQVDADDPDGRAMAAQFMPLLRAMAGEVAEARRAAEETAGAAERERALGSVAEAAAMAGDLAAARDIAGSIGDEQIKAGVLAAVAVSEAASGDVAAALATAAALGDGWPATAAGPAIAAAQAKAGDAAGARRTAGAIEDPGDRYHVLKSIAKDRVRSGDVAGAIESLRAIDPGDPDSNWLVMSMHEIVPMLLEAGDTAGAVEAAGAIGPAGYRAQQLAAISEAQMRAGNAADARQTARAAHEATEAASRARDTTYFSPDMFRQAAAAQAYAGDVTHAAAWAGALTDSDERAHGQLGIAEGLLRRNREAAARLREAADRGDARAQFELAEMYAAGRGVPRDYKQAAGWFAKSAAQGHAPARGREEAMARRARLEEIDRELERVKKDLSQTDAEIAKKDAQLQVLADEAARAEGEIAEINRKLTGFASAAEWDRAYRSAPYLQRRAFLERVKSVDLQVHAEGAGQQYADAIKAAVAAEVTSRGWRIDPASPVTLTVQVFVTTAERTGSRGGRVVERETYRTTVVAAHFRLDALARRGGAFVRVRAAPASNWSMTSGGVGLSARHIRADIAESFDGLMPALRRGGTGRDAATFQRGLWPPEQADEMFRRYAKPGRLAHDLAGLTSVHPVWIDALGEAERMIDAGRTTAAWRNAAAALGLATDTAGDVVIHSVAAAVRSGPRDSWSLYNAVGVTQYDVVYRLDGQLFRGDVSLAWSHVPGIRSGDEVRAELLRQADAMRESFCEEVRAARQGN